MEWWQLLLAGWAVGAVAAFPSLYEYNEAACRLDDVPAWAIVLFTVGGILLWPVAWWSLLAYAARKALRRG